MRFEFFDHTADVLFRAYGATWERVFENAALATFEVLVDTSRVKRDVEVKINLKAGSLEDLALIWLEEILFQSEVNEVMFSEFLIKSLGKNELGEWVLKAVVKGEKMNPDMHLRTEVKAVTRPDFLMTTDEEKGKFVQVLLDI